VIFRGQIPNIYLDMDGVLVDFDAEFQKHLPGHTEDTDWTWQELHEKCPNIYEIAPPMPDFEMLIGFLGRYPRQLHILTAIPKRWNWPDVTKQKRGWINKYLPDIPNDRIRFGPYAEDKQFHCRGLFDLLIDDKFRNCVQWRTKGGTAACHKSAIETIEILRAEGL
jgi:hypothetical protein